MNFIKNNKAVILSIIALIIMIAAVFIWNKIIIKQNEPEPTTPLDVSDANNIPSVEAKLGSDIRITQGYLLTYTRRKSNTWYVSSGYVKNVKINDTIAIITLTASKDSKKSLTATIDSSKWKYKKGDTLNFVGTIDLSNKELSLSKISLESIDYKNVTEIAIDELVDNINQVTSNYFIINGYLVTDEDKFKLFDSKEAYQKDSSVSTYFTIDWKEEFNYTGNTNATIKCLIGDTYKLKSCELQTN